MASAKVISKGIVSVGTWSATKLVVTGVVLPVYSRLLGIEGYGQYAYYVALLLLASQPANCGMRQTLIKYLAEREGETRRQIDLARFAGTVNLVASVAVGAVVALLLFYSLPFDFRGVALILMILGLLWSEQLLQYAGGVLYGLHREEEAALPASVGVILGGAFGVVLAVAGYGVLGVLTGLLAAGILTAAVALQLAWRAVGRVVDSERPVSEGDAQPLPRRELLTFGVSTMAYAGVAMALYSVDVVLVRHFAGDQQTGLYAAAVQWSEFVWFIPIAIEGVMLQATARLWSQDRVQEITQLVSRLVRYVALTTGFLLIFVLVFSQHIVTLYFGPEFIQAALPLQLLVPGAFAFSVARVIRPVLQAQGSVMTLLKIVVVATAANIALNVVLVPWWGAAGAAVATSVSFIGVAFAYVMLLRGEGADAFHGFSVSRFMALCTGTAAVLVPIAFSIRSSVAALAMGGMVAAGLYWAAVLWLGLIRVRELGQIVESLPGPLRGIGIKLMRWCHPMLARFDAIA
jgi:O-antigen/teichoic acid export membrane protein